MANIASLKQELTEPKPRPSSPASVMRKTLNSKSMQELLNETIHANRDAFVASLIDLYGSDSNLAKCNPGLVVREALKAVSLNLPINKQMGFAYIIPYGNVPTFQIGYKGYIQLCMRSGIYKTIHTDVVYEGELVKIDKLTGEVDLSGEKISDTIIGYFAYIETVNGFRKCLYWDRDKVLKHAGRFSKSFQSKSAIWSDFFDEMAQKTVLRNLLSKYGLMSVELQQAFDAETAQAADELLDQSEEEPDGIEADYTVDEETGEILDTEAELV